MTQIHHYLKWRQHLSSSLLLKYLRTKETSPNFSHSRKKGNLKRMRKARTRGKTFNFLHRKRHQVLATNPNTQNDQKEKLH
jgi:hypothetical protein